MTADPEKTDEDLQKTIIEVLDSGGTVLVVGEMIHKNGCPYIKNVEFRENKRILSDNAQPRADLIIFLKTTSHKTDFKIDKHKLADTIVFPRPISTNAIRRLLKAVDKTIKQEKDVA